MWPRRDADRPGHADIVVDGFGVEVVVQDLHTVVRSIGYVHVPLSIHRNPVRRAELTAFRSGFLAANLLEESAILVVLDDSVIDVSVRHEDVALGVPGDIRRTAKQVLLSRRRRACG